MDDSSNTVFVGLLTTKAAASRLQVSPRTLEHWREVGGGPPFLKVGRSVRYEHEAIATFLSERRCMSTAEARSNSSERAMAISGKSNIAPRQHRDSRR